MAADVVEHLTLKLRERFPGIQITGTYAPPFRPITPEEGATIVERINRRGRISSGLDWGPPRKSTGRSRTWERLWRPFSLGSAQPLISIRDAKRTPLLDDSHGTGVEQFVEKLS